MNNVIKTVGVVGAGIMGRGICQLAAQGGYTVFLYDMQADAADRARDFAVAMLRRAIEKRRMSADLAKAAIARIHTVTDVSSFVECDLVIEAIVERLEPKQALLSELEAIIRDNAILATNTSSLSVAAIASKCQNPERIAGLHFFNPVPLMKLVEVVSTSKTAPFVIKLLTDFVSRCGHNPVQARDFPGFLVNHAGRAFVTEGLQILEEGVCEPVVLDDVMRQSLGFKMGPCELLDLTGLDVSVPVMEEIFTRFYNESRLRPPVLGRTRMESGLLGRKSGEGFYSYNKSGERKPNNQVQIECDSKPPSLVAIEADRDACEILKTWLENKGARLVPVSDAELIFVAPIGGDVTSEITSRSLDPGRVVGVDVLFGLGGHTTIFVTPATDIEVQRDALVLAQCAENSASVVQDSAGLLCQRVLSMIVNVACEIAEKGIGTPQDIDLAVKLGLGYPMGPLEWGEKIGARTVLKILEALLKLTGDPRYRPSAWLRRRALLNMPLTQAVT